MEAITNHPTMLYDGVCGLCDGVVRFLIKHDRRDQLRFAPQQSKLAKTILGRHGIDKEAALPNNSVYLVLNPKTPHEQLLARSDVTVSCLLILGGPWAIAGHILRLVPKFLRDAAYNLIARNRYRIIKKLDACPIPPPKIRSKFLA
jgi:predicted DCC family thiol-disulfide oxidoreductase YuxK